MEAEALIDKVMKKHHQLPAGKIASASYAPLRESILDDAQNELIDFFSLRDWTFKYKEDQITIAAGDSDVALDSEGEGAPLTYPWGNEGQQGGVFLPDCQGQLTWRRLGDLQSLLKTSTERGIPRCYSVSGMYSLLVWPPCSAETVLTVFYEMAPPTLTDADESSGLDLIPDQWARSVIYYGTVLRQMQSKGEVGPSMQIIDNLHKRAIFSACCAEAQGKPEPRYLPRYAGAADVFVDPW